MNSRNRLTNGHIVKMGHIQYKSIVRTLQKEEWIFHKGDVDAVYGIPHGHLFKEVKGRTAKCKLELWSGNIYDADTKKVTGQVKNDEMQTLYRDVKFRVFIAEARRAYEDRYPSVYLRPLITNPKLKKSMQTRRARVLRVGMLNIYDKIASTYKCDMETIWF